MFEENELLTDTFVTHSQVAPDVDDVLAKVDAIARTHRRNRWVVRSSGVALASAGLVFAAVALPAAVSGTHHGAGSSIVTPADGGGTGSGTGGYTTDQEMTAFFEAGYVYQDAKQLASIWHETDIDQVKAEAGGKLLAGDKLPVDPSGTPASPQEKAVNVFFNDGYGINDAEKLAQIWNVSTYQAKLEGGQKLENGETLPVQPTGDDSTATPSTPTSVDSARLKQAILRKERTAGSDGAVPSPTGGSAASDPVSPAQTAYFDAGYDYDDAVQLGKIWNETDLTQVKTEAGQKLIAGEKLPIPPSGDPAPPDNAANDQAVATFFDDGYDYNDAVQLGKMWNVSSYQAKVAGGKKLENGETLPIQPGG